MFDYAPFRRRLFGISPDETRFARRGFPPAEPTIQAHLETAGRSFVDGYNAAVAKPLPDDIAAQLEPIDDKYRGFAFEGAAMALALLDRLTPWNRSRFQAYCQSPAGDRHWYMLHIGAGWALARLPWTRRNFERAMTDYAPLYRWLALDGYGFHEGFFHASDFVDKRQLAAGLSNAGQQVFDQGLGRSMWFSQGANPDRLAAAIARFPAERREDLWSGAGLAASYAGGVDRSVLLQLRDHAVGFESHLAQGAAFAAKARQRAENLVPHTEVACDVFCHLPAHEAAAVTDQCLVDLPADGAEPAYQVWRQRIRERLAAASARIGTDRTAAAMPS